MKQQKSCLAECLFCGRDAAHYFLVSGAYQAWCDHHTWKYPAEEQAETVIAITEQEFLAAEVIEK